MCMNICVYEYIYTTYRSSHISVFYNMNSQITCSYVLKCDGYTLERAVSRGWGSSSELLESNSGKHGLLWFLGKSAASGGHMPTVLAPAWCKCQGSWIWLRLFSASQLPPGQRKKKWEFQSMNDSRTWMNQRALAFLPILKHVRCGNNPRFILAALDRV